MNDTTEDISFYKGETNVLETETEEEKRKKIQLELTKVFSASRLSFLLGSGCSSEAVPTIDIIKSNLETKIKERIKKKLGENNYDDKNLEEILAILYSGKFYLDNTKNDNKKNNNDINDIIEKIKKHIYSACENPEWQNSNEEEKKKYESTLKKYESTLKNYETFYKKLMYRENTLSKINIFTTNYDLFNERAMDNLGIIYCNGFSGNIHRFFNPMTFNYAYAEQIGLSDQKYNVLDKYIYLYKLHGSVNWVKSQKENTLFNIEEKQTASFDNDHIMIYPTTTKGSNSLSSPYSDLFREFQKKIMIEDNVLVVIGYSFGDDHVNNIIYQALATIPKFKLIVFSHENITNNNEIKKIKELKKLKELDDPRIWMIEGTDKEEKEEKNIASFDYIVNKLLIETHEDDKRIEESIKKVKVLRK